MKGRSSHKVVTTSAWLLFAGCVLFLQAAASFAQNVVSFGSATTVSPGNKPFSVVAADFNGDGKLDLAVANGGDFSASPLIPGRISVLLGEGDGTFDPAVNFAAGAVPSSLAVADFNGDGKLDLAVANLGSNNVSVLLGDGAGAFAPASNLNVGTAPRSIAVGDLNGDGRADLVVANSGDSSASPSLPASVSILLGNGDGTFVTAAGPPVADGDNPVSVALGDFNGDGKLDLVVVNSGANNVSVHLGNGDGSFVAPVNFPAGTTPVFVTVEDLNGDGKDDLAVVNSAGNNVSVFLGDGTGSFAAAKNYTVGTAPVSLSAGDFDGDGKLDLAVANSAASRVSILRGKGDGTFNPAVNCCTGSGSWSVAVGDFNSDGKLDLVVTNISGNNVSFFEGDGTGAFKTPTTFSLGTFPASLAVGDFDGDGKLDLALEELSLLGNGEGGFDAATNYTVGAAPRAVATADFNGDGNLDLVVANSGSNDVSVLLGSGTGAFGSAARFAVEEAPVALAVGDLNSDGKLDLIVANSGDDSGPTVTPGSISILLGNGDGTFAAATNYAAGTKPAGVALGDFNGDGKLDLAVANSADESGSSVVAGNVSILLGNGDGTFAAATNYTAGTNPVSVAAEDFDGDGKTDLAVVNGDAQSGSTTVPGNLAILSGQGDGTFAAPKNYTVGTDPAAVTLGDFNWDGQVDLAVANFGSNSVSVLMGKADGSFVAAPTLGVGSGPASIAVGDFNGDGRPDLAVVNTLARNISILLNTTINPNASHTLAVASSNPDTGVSITITPKDNSNATNGVTPLSRRYNEGTTATLLAPATAGANNFVRWDGCNSAAGTTCNAIMMADKTVTAVYAEPLPLAGSILPDMEVNVSYDTPLVSGGVGPYTFKTTTGILPAGLSGNATNGHLTGTPKSPLSKKVSFSVLVTDANGLSATGAFKATGYAAVTIGTKSLKAATHGKSYKGKLSVSGGKKPFAWSETSGNLTAAGLALDPATGAITGTPPAAGTFSLHFRVTDALGGTNEKDLPLTIK